MSPAKIVSHGVRKSIHVFDLDDTLIQTEAKVRVLDQSGNAVNILSPAEFTTYSLNVGESFDFRDFADVGILARGIVLEYTRAIIETLKQRGTQSDFGIITARGDKNLHAPFLIRLFDALFGIPLKNSRIFNLSDQRFAKHKESIALPEAFQGKHYGELTISEKKALIIAQDLHKKGYNDISLYDDSRDNLESFKVIRHAFPEMIYHPHFIDPSWKVRLAEFATSALQRKSLTRGKASVRILLENHSTFRGQWEQGLTELELRGKLPLTFPGVLLLAENGKYALGKG